MLFKHHLYVFYSAGSNILFVALGCITSKSAIIYYCICLSFDTFDVAIYIVWQYPMKQKIQRKIEWNKEKLVNTILYE